MSLGRAEKTRAQQFGNEVTDGLGHLRSAAVIAAERAAEAVAPRVDTARVALSPRVDAAREVLVPRLDAARGAMSPRVEAARSAVGKSWDTTVQAVAPVVTAAADSARRSTEEARKAAGKKAGKARKKAGKKLDRARAAATGNQRRRRWPWVVGAVALGLAVGTAAAVVSRRSTANWDEYEPEHEFAEPSSVFAEARERATENAESGKADAGKEKPADAAENAKSAVADAAKNGAKASRATEARSNGHKA